MSSPELPNRALQRPTSFLASLGRLLAAECQIVIQTEVQASMASLKTFRIDDDLAGASAGAIEVTVTMEDGASRWCYFMTPSALAAAGDWVPGTQVRYLMAPRT